MAAVAGYTKLFSTILASTIWREPANVRVVWITMLAMADAEGRVDGSVPGLADLARVTLDECQVALKCLSDPDFFSRTKDNEGRRIREIDGGWHILNYLKYREATPTDLRREQNRDAQRRWREKRKLTVSKVSERNAPSAQAEALCIEQKHKQTEDEWLASLAVNPVYSGIDIKVQLGKAQVWCETNQRKCSRKFFVNWLNRAEKPISTNGTKTDSRPNSRRYEQTADYSKLPGQQLAPPS